MEKNKRLVSILHGFTNFGFYFSIIVAALLVAGTIVLQFVPLPEVGNGFLQSRFVLDNSFTFEFSLRDNADFLPVLTRFLVTSVVAILSVTAMTYFLKEILGNVKEDKVFVEQNSLFIKYLGYTLIGTSLVVGVLRMWATMGLMNIINFPGGHFGANYSPSLETIFIGLIIVVLSQVFAYGTHLQNEYDATV
jgi:hypothetical protein